MSKKKKKNHNPDEVVEVIHHYSYLDTVNYEWTGQEWSIIQIGVNWWPVLQNRASDCLNSIIRDNKFSYLDSWSMINKLESNIDKYRLDPIFQIDPDPMFLRRWLDQWIDLQYCRLWCHISDHLRLKRGMKELDAHKQADNLAGKFEALFCPTKQRPTGKQRYA